MKEILLRFLIGGAFVSGFAFIGDIFRPKSFAGLFGAAPSIALATLTLTIATTGKHDAIVETHSMMAGAIAFFVYASCVSWLMMKKNSSALQTTSLLMVVWFAAAFGLWFAWLR